MSDFAEVLNQTGFSHILSRYEKDLKSFTRILKNIQAKNGTLDQEGLEQIKIIEQLFFEDETDLMNVDIITSEEAESAQTIIETIEQTENLTEIVCANVDEAIKTQDTNLSSTTQISTVTENTTDTEGSDLNSSSQAPWSQESTTESTTEGDTIGTEGALLDSESQISTTAETETTTTEIAIASESQTAIVDDDTDIDTTKNDTELADSEREFSRMAGGFPVLLFDL